MTRLKKANESLKFDSRLTRYNLQNDRLTEEEFKNHIDSLEDLSDRAEKIQISEDDGGPDTDFQ